MRQMISALAAAIAVMAASAAPALACGVAYAPCAPTYYAPAYAYSGCNPGCGGWAYERLADPEQQYHVAPVRHQYYYVNQGPTFSGPDAFAPYPVYREVRWHAYRHRAWHHYRHYGYREHVLRRYY